MTKKMKTMKKLINNKIMNNRIKINKEHQIFKEIKIIKKASNQTSNIIMINGTKIKECFKLKIKMDLKMKKNIKKLI